MSVIYKDLGNDPSSTPVVINQYAVFQSICNLFSTGFQERLFRENYWMELEQFLMEEMSVQTTSSIYSMVIQRLPANEPRLNLRTDLSQIIPDYEGNRYKIALYFSINGLDNDQFEYFGILNRPAATK